MINRRDNTIGAVILNYFTYDDTIRLVTDLQKQTGAIQLQIVIVDNCSPNESYKILSEKYANSDNVNVLKTERNGGYAYGNNAGLRYLEKTRPQFVAIMNNDIYFDNNTLDSLVKVYQEIKDVGIISPVQFIDEETISGGPSLFLPSFTEDFFGNLLSYRLLKRKSNIDLNSEHALTQVDVIIGSFIFIDFELFKSIGYFFPGTFLYGEERFIAMKIKKIGKKNFLVNNLKYIHKHSTTINKFVPDFRKRKYLHQSKLKYTREFRDYAKIKCFALSLTFYFGSMETFFYRKASILYSGLKKHRNID